MDPAALAFAREQFVVRHPRQAAEVKDWDDITFRNKARLLREGAVTDSALLLLGCPESATMLAPADTKISWFLKNAQNQELDYEHIWPHFLIAGDRLLRRVRNLVVRFMPNRTVFPIESNQYDPWCFGRLCTTASRIKTIT